MGTGGKRRMLVLGSPVLSHLLMVVLGMGVHQIFAPARGGNVPQLRAHRVYIVLPKKMQIYGKVKEKQKLGFMVKDAGERCRLSFRGVAVHHVYRKTVVIALTMAKTTDVISYLRGGSVDGIFAEGDKLAAR